MSAKLTELGLAAHFPSDCWPTARATHCCLHFGPSGVHFSLGDQANAVRKLATRVASFKNYGMETVFIAVDLKECVATLLR